MTKEKTIVSKQKKLYTLLMGGVILTIGGFITYMMPGDTKAKEVAQDPQFESAMSTIEPEAIRLTSLENLGHILDDRMQNLEKSLLDLQEEKELLSQQNRDLVDQTHAFQSQIEQLHHQHLAEKKEIIETLSTSFTEAPQTPSIVPQITSWVNDENSEERSVLFEIPAGTVVKAVLVSGADCSVAIQKPTGPNMVLLRPLDDGKLPRHVKVPLKGSVIIGNAIGDIASERVYIRAERMTLVQRNGDFIETDVSAYVSGEDGREGMRGIVVDRSGSIISRAAFASFLQGVGQGIEATLNNQTLEKLARVSSDQTILNIDMLRTSGLQGGATALNKLSDYYIKRAEQLQPAIQIAAGRTVEIVFTKTVKVGESDLRKKLAHEREIKNG